MPANCLQHDRDGYVIACPECDGPSCVRDRERENTSAGNPTDPYACARCGATFHSYVERERKPRADGGSAAKYEDLSLADVGLDGGPW